MMKWPRDEEPMPVPAVICGFLPPVTFLIDGGARGATHLAVGLSVILVSAALLAVDRLKGGCYPARVIAILIAWSVYWQLRPDHRVWMSWLIAGLLVWGVVGLVLWTISTATHPREERGDLSSPGDEKSRSYPG